MFKRVLVAIFIFLFLITLCILCFISSKNMTKDLANNISKIRENIVDEKVNLALEETKKLEKKWTEKSRKMSMFLDHIKIETVDQTIVALKINLETKRPEDAYVELGKIEKFLEHIENSEIPNISNIL